MEKIVLVGFGGHARSVADSVERIGIYDIIGYTDIKKSDIDNGYKYLGTDDELEDIYAKGIHCAVITLGQMGVDTIRHKLYQKLKSIGFKLPVIVDPSAIISNNSIIGEGTFIGKNVVVNSNTKIGKMSIINTGAICEHDNIIGEFTHLAVGVTCSGTVSIGNNSFVGVNSTIIQNIKIGNNVIIGAGSTVIVDVKDDFKVYGVVKKNMYSVER